jgi:hypothetical protein
MKKPFQIYDEKTLLKYTGNFDSLNSIRKVEILEGKARGCQAYEISCIGGLRLSILIDRGLDIAEASYKGVPFSYISKNGITGPHGINPHEDEFVRYFTGGLLTTCGLRNAGPSCREDSGEYHPLHGRINGIPAQNASAIRLDRHRIEISGEMHETALFGPHLVLLRRITIDGEHSAIRIRDTLRNETETDEEYMLIYHCNFGFPFLQEGCFLEFSQKDQVIPRTEKAKKGLADHRNISEPIDHYEEQVFFHLQQSDSNGMASAAIVNPHLSMKAALSYSAQTLPVLVQWKSMRSGDYALGLEPSNNYVKGRIAERSNGTLRKIAGYSSETFEIEITMTDLTSV